jgi:two-component system response regulator CpxR
LNPEILENNGVRLNLKTGEASCDGVPVDLTTIEFGILECLVRSAGRMVSTDELADFLSRRQVNPFEGSLDMQVREVRRKLERGRRLIRTIEGAGYVFATEEGQPASGYRLA